MKNSVMTFVVICMAVISTGCKSKNMDSGNQPDMLTTIAEWQLSSINGNAPVADQYSRGLPSAAFTKENKVSGHGGCNRYSGEYTLDGDKLTFGKMLSTKMFCPGGGEEVYMKALGSITAFKASKDKLILLNGSQEVLVFVPKKG